MNTTVALHYFDFFIKREEKPDASQMTPLTTRVVLSGIHHFLRNTNRSNIGVAFPQWRDAAGAGSLPEVGKTVRVISEDATALFEMRGHAWFTCQILTGDIAVSKIKEVPAGVSHVCYVRNREAEMAARDLKRATGKPVNILSINRQSDDPAARLRFMTPTKTVNMLVKKVPVADRLQGEFSSYGLCCKEMMVSVPDF